MALIRDLYHPDDIPHELVNLYQMRMFNCKMFSVGPYIQLFITPLLSVRSPFIPFYFEYHLRIWCVTDIRRLGRSIVAKEASTAQHKSFPQLFYV